MGIADGASWEETAGFCPILAGSYLYRIEDWNPSGDPVFEEAIIAARAL